MFTPSWSGVVDPHFVVVVRWSVITVALFGSAAMPCMSLWRRSVQIGTIGTYPMQKLLLRLTSQELGLKRRKAKTSKIHLTPLQPSRAQDGPLSNHDNFVGPIIGILALAMLFAAKQLLGYAATLFAMVYMKSYRISDACGIKLNVRTGSDHKRKNVPSL